MQTERQERVSALQAQAQGGTLQYDSLAVADRMLARLQQDIDARPGPDMLPLGESGEADGRWRDEFLLFYPVEELTPIEAVVAMDVWTESGRQLRADRQGFEAWQARKAQPVPLPDDLDGTRPDILPCVVVLLFFFVCALLFGLVGESHVD